MNTSSKRTLDALQKLHAAVPGSLLIHELGDVAVVKYGLLEVAYEEGGSYDLWDSGDLRRPDMTLIEAIEVLLTAQPSWQRRPQRS